MMVPTNQKISFNQIYNRYLDPKEKKPPTAVFLICKNQLQGYVVSTVLYGRKKYETIIYTIINEDPLNLNNFRRFSTSRAQAIKNHNEAIFEVKQAQNERLKHLFDGAHKTGQKHVR